ncbi:MAG: tryptophan-rich sensory protein, partial [Bacteroidetes bacterium]|nr:tryptophan-rich sensory protein [Bacteroidota bacterium]
WLLNVLWNPLFFYLHQTGISLVEIVSLTILIGFFLFRYRDQMGWKSILLLPYFLWLLIATSLNGYIHLNN